MNEEYSKQLINIIWYGTKIGSKESIDHGTGGIVGRYESVGRYELYMLRQSLGVRSPLRSYL